MHELPAGTCSLCSGRGKPAATGTGGVRGSAKALDTPEALEDYRSRYIPDREATFEAYVEVFFHSASARNFPRGWTMFSRCANAEPALVRDEAKLVARAEEIMRLAGYEADDSGRPRRGRTWRKASTVEMPPR